MQNRDLKVYVGYDSREDIAWQVCRNSILRHASRNLEVYPLKLNPLKELGIYKRDRDNASTEFSISRFLTPWLSAHNGWSIFVDCDFLFTGDIFSLFDEIHEGKGIYVVKHEYTPAHSIKMDGQKQSVYPRKNWSSFILFDCSNSDVVNLTPNVVNSASPAYLHRFQWIDDSLIGDLDRKWNFLVGEYLPPDGTPIGIHYTNGGPWFEEWQNVDFADLWVSEKNFMRTKT